MEFVEVAVMPVVRVDSTTLLRFIGNDDSEWRSEVLAACGTLRVHSGYAEFVSPLPALPYACRESATRINAEVLTCNCRSADCVHNLQWCHLYDNMSFADRHGY